MAVEISEGTSARESDVIPTKPASANQTPRLI
jgi:hypothetical protein